MPLRNGALDLCKKAFVADTAKASETTLLFLMGSYVNANHCCSIERYNDTTWHNFFLHCVTEVVVVVCGSAVDLPVLHCS